jgi:hypothetical protein
MADKKDEKGEEKKTSAGVCGFENKQYFSDEGKKMTCVLPKGHTGDHAAPLPEKGANENVRVAFSDAAGVPLEPAIVAKLEAAKEKREADAKERLQSVAKAPAQ